MMLLKCNEPRPLVKQEVLSEMNWASAAIHSFWITLFPICCGDPYTSTIWAVCIVDSMSYNYPTCKVFY